MGERTRKLIGTILLVAFVVFYALVVMTIAAAKLPGTSWFVQLVFYAVAGLVWVAPAAWLIYWMARPRKSDS